MYIDQYQEREIIVNIVPIRCPCLVFLLVLRIVSCYFEDSVVGSSSDSLGESNLSRILSIENGKQRDQLISLPIEAKV